MGSSELEVRHQRALMAALPAGVLHLDADGVPRFMNVRFRELWHLTLDEDPAAVDWSQDVHPDDRERVLQGWAAAVDGDGAYETEFRVLAPDGGSRWTWARAVPEHDEAGEAGSASWRPCSTSTSAAAPKRRSAAASACTG